MVIPTSESETKPTYFNGNKFYTTVNITTVKASSEDGDVFYETPAAQGISGLFVALAILITVHQASILSKFNKLVLNFMFSSRVYIK
jgi:hypothetical protein